MIREFTATAYVIEEDKVLMIYHRKLGKWLPPGGHLDPGELPTEGVIREVLEETGIEVEIINQDPIWVERWNARSFERPYLCLLEEIPAFGDMPAHQHMDFVYLAKKIGGCLLQNPKEVEAIRWFTLEQIEQLRPDKEIFVETLEVLRAIFETASQTVNT